MKRLQASLVFFVALVSLSIAGPIIGGFSLNEPMMNLSTQPYELYYYPGFSYEFSYSPQGWSVGAGWSIPIPWMNFSQIPLRKSEIPVALAMAKAESGFQNYSRSKAGAEGLMQFIPSTARAYGISNPFNPFQSVQGALNYISEYQERFASLKLAIASYNAGPGAVAKYKGVPPYPETQAYVSRVMKYMKEYSDVTKYPEIYARMGFFAEYNSSQKVTVGLSYPLPPGNMDICPELTFDGTKVSISWILRTKALGVNVAVRHLPNVDELELSDTFGPLTAVVGRYEKGLAASGIINLWGFRLFGSVSQWGEVRYGALVSIFGVQFKAWKTDNSYALAMSGRW